MGLKHGDGRDQGPDPGRDADGHDKHVVEHERRGREQTRGRAQVFPSHRVGSPSVRIGADRLPVRKIDDEQEQDDQRADRADVTDSGSAQGNEQGQGRFRTVGCRAESVEPEHRDSRQHAHALLAFLERCQATAEQIIGKRHDSSFTIAIGYSWNFSRMDRPPGDRGHGSSRSHTLENANLPLANLHLVSALHTSTILTLP